MVIAALNTLDSALTGSGLMCGTDEAGLAFFLDYRKGGQAVISAGESAVNAFRNVGYGVEVSAHNYSVSDAVSTVGGGRESIPVPAEPTKYSASGVPGQSGPEIPQPSLWSIVQQFVGGSWPNGNPDTMRAVAGAWRAFGTAVSTASGDAGDCLSGVSGHDIPELVHITDALNTLTSRSGDLAGKCNAIAEQLETFAGEVQSSQDAIRDLLHRLSASGILSEIGKIFSGHNPMDDLKQIGHDISEILHTLSRELEASASGFQLLIDGMDGLVRDFEEWDRKVFTQFFGDQVGNVLADRVNAYADLEEGLAKSVLGTAESIPTLLAHPVDTVKGIVTLEKDAAEFLNPLGPLLDPEGQQQAGDHLLEAGKTLVDYEDLTSDRPMVGVGVNIGNIAQVLIPGAGEAKAGLTAGRAGEEAAQIARAEGKATRGGVEALGKTSGKELADQAGKIGTDLDGLGTKPVEVPKAPEPVARPTESGPAPAAKPAEDGASGGNTGAGKAPVDAGARPGAEASPHGGSEPPVAGHGAGEPAPGAPHGNGSHAPAPVHASTGEGAPSSAGPHEASAAGGAAPHEAPAPQEMADAHSDGHGGWEPAQGDISGHGTSHNGESVPPRDGPDGSGPNDEPNNPPHTGLHDPPLNQGVPGDALPDLTDINKEYRLSNGEVDPDRFGEWAQKVSDEYPSLTKDGVEGVYDYTTENYDGMNPYLRNVDPLNPLQQDILDANAIDQMTDAQRAHWEERISHADEGLSGLPPYRGDPDDPFSTTWRGMRATDSLLDQFVEGRLFSDPAYLSTSTDSHVAEQFARGAGENQTPTLLKIEGYDGVDVKQLSRYMQESEILFPRGTEFEVVSRTLGDDGVLRIILRQVFR